MLCIYGTTQLSLPSPKQLYLSSTHSLESHLLCLKPTEMANRLPFGSTPLHAIDVILHVGGGGRGGDGGLAVDSAVAAAKGAAATAAARAVARAAARGVDCKL